MRTQQVRSTFHHLADAPPLMPLYSCCRAAVCHLCPCIQEVAVECGTGLGHAFNQASARAFWVWVDCAHLALFLLSRQKKSDNSFTFYAKCGQSVAVYLSDSKFSNQKGPLVSCAAASFT